MRGRIFVSSALWLSLIFAGYSICFGQGFRVEPTGIDFGSTTRKKKVFIFKDGTNPVSWTASTSSDWISISPNSGTVEREYAYFKITVSRGNLSRGDYIGTVVVETNEGRQNITVKAHSFGEPEVRMKYYINIEEPATHYAHVRIVMENVSSMDCLKLDSHRWEKKYLYFENIKAYDHNNQPLNFTTRTEYESLIWVYIDINNTNRSHTVTLEYDVHYLSTCNGNLENLHTGILADRAMFDMQHWLFQFGNMPFDPREVETEIIFDGPQDWVVVSPWEGSVRHFRGTNDKIFLPTPGFGNYELITFSLNGLEVRVGIPPGAYDYLPVSRDELIEMIKTGMAAFQKIYGNPSRSQAGLDDIVEIIVTYPPMPSQESGWGSALLRVQDKREDEFQYWAVYCMGELLKLWIGDGYPMRQTLWRYEQLMNLGRLGYQDITWSTQMIEGWNVVYMKDIIKTQFDISVPELCNLFNHNNADQLTEKDREGYQRSIDNKMPLMWYVIDRTIQEKSGGYKNLYDFFGYMNQHFAANYTIEDVINALSLVANWDFSQFFQDYYYGTKRLPVDNYLSNGDVAPFGNRDGSINVGDALVTLRFALDLETPTQQDTEHGDVAPLDANNHPNPDGYITVGDAMVILRKALGIIEF